MADLEGDLQAVLDHAEMMVVAEGYARMAGRFFGTLLEDGMTREEALVLTRVFVPSLMEMDGVEVDDDGEV